MVAPFSRASRALKEKIPWGALDSVEYGTEVKDGKLEEFFRFYKGTESEKLFLSSMNSLVVGVNPLAQKIQSLVVMNKKKLLSQYLSLLMKSDGYQSHHAAIFSADGFRVDESGLQTNHIEENGGNLIDLRELRVAARASVCKMDSTVPKQKRKGSGIEKFLLKKPRMSAKDTQKTEIEDPDGPEAKYSKSYIGEPQS